MHSEKFYVPKVFVCGELSDFYSQTGERPAKIIGEIKLKGIFDGQNFDFPVDGKFLLDGKFFTKDDLKKFLSDGTADFLILTDLMEYYRIFQYILNNDLLHAQIITLDQFKYLPQKNFYTIFNEAQLFSSMKILDFNTLLDVDAYFHQGKFFCREFDKKIFEIDAICDKPINPIAENIYNRVYEKLSDCRFKHYDAVLIAERQPLDFDRIFGFLENYSDVVIVFVRKNSELENHITATNHLYSDVKVLKVVNGSWFFIYRKKTAEDFKIYSVTHKKTPHDGKLPKDYIIFQSGKAINENCGYPGDDEGENISELNHYLNEFTSMYWIWKHTSHTKIGFVHYRRFFTAGKETAFSYDKILTVEQANNLLEKYDIIVEKAFCGYFTQHEFIEKTCGEGLLKISESAIKKALAKYQPEYLDAFDFVMNSTSLYKCNLMITRRYIFDAYCEFLFPTILEATQEILQKTNLKNLSGQQSRVMGFLAERMLTVWLVKNRLRIKELEIMFIDGI